MTPPDHDALASLFHAGAAQASQALALWLGRPASMLIDRLTRLSLIDAVGVLGGADAEPLCGCGMRVTGALSGGLLLAASDTAGLALADLILNRPVGCSTNWGELEQSAVTETANIVGCSYLNAIAARMPGDRSGGILPSPPQFIRDYPAAVMEAAVVSQAAASETVVLAESAFRLAGVPIRCGLVFVPDRDGFDLFGAAWNEPRS